jgi:L-threonylcarbamoyladenylate synthase
MSSPKLEVETAQMLIARRGAPLLAAQYIEQGELVVFPTDTVYGIGTTPYHAGAIDRLYEAKERPTDKGIPVLIADMHHLDRVAAGGWQAMPHYARRLAEAFWPGSLTLILPKSPALAQNISDNDNVAVRLIDHDLSRAMIRAAGGAVAATSANLSAKPPARTAAEAMLAFRGKVALILDGGLSPQKVASTIIDCTGPRPRLLRRGPIELEALEQAAGLAIDGGEVT